VLKIGENLKVSRVLKFEATGVGRVSAYVHTGAKIAVLLELGLKTQAAAANPEVAELARQLAMQVVANNARFVRRDEVSADVVAKEREIAAEFTKSEADKAIDEAKRIVEDYKGQLVEQKAANDAEAIAELEKRIAVGEKQIVAAEGRKKGQLANMEKIISGRVDKFFAESCLLEQAYFRDPDQKIQDLIAAAKTKVGEEVSIVRFTRFQVGETAAE